MDKACQIRLSSRQNGDRCETFIGLCGEIDDDAAEQGTHTNSRSVYTKIGRIRLAKLGYHQDKFVVPHSRGRTDFRIDTTAIRVRT
jgi:hypothetical protein